MPMSGLDIVPLKFTNLFLKDCEAFWPTNLLKCIEQLEQYTLLIDA